MFSKKYFSIFLGVYFVLRIFSYFFGPETPLQPQSWPNTALAVVILLLVVYFLIRKNPWGWYLIGLEIVLGGAGGFLSIGSLSLRTCLLVVSIAIFDVNKALEGKYVLKLRENKVITIFFAIIFLVVGLAAWRGYFLGHGVRAIFADVVPYLFLLYFYPLRELIHSEKFKRIIFNGILSAICGNVLLILITAAGLSAQTFVLQDNYYHWYRDVALGKISDLGMGFYRLVLNEHLLLTPLALYFFYRIIEKKGKEWLNFLILFCFLFLFSFNLTRSYLLAFSIGSLLFINRTNWRRWLLCGFTTCFSFIFIFSATHLLTTCGRSLGWEIFGWRLQSITQPQLEDSSLSRLILLPKIMEKIRIHPFVGSGLADTVTAYSPVFKQEITTPNFDWGYLEIWDELGIFGLTIWLVFLCYILKINRHKKYPLAATTALMVVNFTSPALFHVLGIIFLVVIISGIDKKIQE